MNAQIVNEPMVQLTLSPRQAFLLRALLGTTNFQEGTDLINNSGGMNKMVAIKHTNPKTSKEEFINLVEEFTSALDKVIYN